MTPSQKEELGIRLFVGFIVALTIGLVIYKKVQNGTSWSNDQDFQLKNLIAISNKAGSDIFDGVSIEKSKEIFKNATSKDMYRLSELIKIGEKSWTPSQKTEFTSLFQKSTRK